MGVIDDRILTLIGYMLCLIILDVALGIAKAIVRKQVASSVMREGLWHKLAEVSAVLLIWILCQVVVILKGPDMSFQATSLAIGYIMVMEAVSILENIAQINPALAASGFMQIFRDVLEYIPGGQQDVTPKHAADGKDDHDVSDDHTVQGG